MGFIVLADTQTVVRSAIDHCGNFKCTKAEPICLWIGKFTCVGLDELAASAIVNIPQNFRGRIRMDRHSKFLRWFGYHGWQTVYIEPLFKWQTDRSGTLVYVDGWPTRRKIVRYFGRDYS